MNDLKLVPKHYPLNEDDPRTQLHRNLIDALEAVPHHFDSVINLEGMAATDLFALNTVLGGAIEEETVRILNSLREVWDSEGRWYDHAFVRFPESFPDVRLVKSPFDENPIIGIELKGWYLLSKEGEPSYRFRASANAMSVYDLLACYPWSLSNVISGKPVLHTPLVAQAKYAADMRTCYWVGIKKGKNRHIDHPDTHPYPEPRSKYIDKPVTDSTNFGRMGRVHGFMKDFCTQSLDIKLAGIEAKYWTSFLGVFSERNTAEQIRASVQSLVERVEKDKAIYGNDDSIITDAILGILDSLQ